MDATVIMNLPPPVSAPYDRRSLNFCAEVENQFSFLEKSGFTRVSLEETMVEFTKNYFSIIIFHGRKSYEVGLEINVNGKIYPLSSLFRACDAKKSAVYRQDVAKTSYQIVNSLKKIRAIFLKCVFNNIENEDFFRKSDRLNREFREKMATESRISAYLYQARDEFSKKNYDKSIELYERIDSQLEKSDELKIKFAKKIVRNMQF